MMFIHQFGTALCIFIFLFIQGLLLVYIVDKYHQNKKITIPTFLMLGFCFSITLGLYYFLDMINEFYLIPLIVIYGIEMLILLAFYILKRI